jgi:hypothetical protein
MPCGPDPEPLAGWRQPFRNPSCRSYKTCLAIFAVLDRHTGMQCEGCGHYQAEETAFSFGEITGCVRLLAEVLEADQVLILSGMAADERDQVDKRGGRWVQPEKAI